MDIIAFSDVQANLPALEALLEIIDRERPDLVLMNGDLVNRGPRSLDCLRRWQAACQGPGQWVSLRGNHEDFVLHCQRRPSSTPTKAALRRFTDWTAAQLGEAAAEMAGWGDHWCLTPAAGGHWLWATHGSLAGNRYGILADTPEAVLAERVPGSARVFLTAHTHRPLLREYGDTLICNLGSAGSPFDGDPRGSYARLRWTGGRWQVRLHRFDYDRAQAARDFSDSGFLDGGGPLARLIFTEWRIAEGLMQRWNQQWREGVLAGEVDLDTAVTRFLDGVGAAAAAG